MRSRPGCGPAVHFGSEPLASALFGEPFIITAAGDSDLLTPELVSVNSLEPSEKAANLFIYLLLSSVYSFGLPPPSDPRKGGLNHNLSARRAWRLPKTSSGSITALFFPLARHRSRLDQDIGGHAGRNHGRWN